MQALDPVQYLLTLLTQLCFAMLAKSWKYFLVHKIQDMWWALSIQLFASYLEDETT